jgi:hypothetical protein
VTYWRPGSCLVWPFVPNICLHTLQYNGSFDEVTYKIFIPAFPGGGLGPIAQVFARLFHMGIVNPDTSLTPRLSEVGFGRRIQEIREIGNKGISSSSKSGGWACCDLANAPRGK